VNGRHRILVIVIRILARPVGQACSSDVFPLPVGAEMIVVRFPAALSSVATRS
jgi:hypothetical protein